MELRERLLRNEVRLLADDLWAVSEELLTLQDFIKQEFGQKYLRFCQARSSSNRNGDSGKDEQSRRFGSRAYLFPRIESTTTSVEADQEESDASDQAIYNASDNQNGGDFEGTGSEDGADDEYETNVQPTFTSKRAKKESEDPDFDPSQYVNLDFSKGKYIASSTKQPSKPRAKKEYLVVQEYVNLEEAKRVIEDHWIGGRSEVLFNGTKYKYRCKESRKCPKMMYLLAPSQKFGAVGKLSDTKVGQWESLDEHANHDDNDQDPNLGLLQNCIDGSEGPVRFIKSIRGSEKAVLNGFVFIRNSNAPTATYYVCDQHRKGCNVRLTMYPDRPYKINGTHIGHKPDMGRIRAMEVVEAGKKLMLENSSLPTTQILGHVESMVLEDPVCAKYMGTPSSFKRKILRARQRARQKEGQLEVKLEGTEEILATGGELGSGPGPGHQDCL